MKRKLLFNLNAKRWNNFLRQFNNLYQRIKTGNLTERQHQLLTNKLQKIFNRLERMQYKVGIKLAGTALALMMLSATSFAQEFSSVGYLTCNNNEMFGDDIQPTYANIDGDGDLDLYVGDQEGNIKTFNNGGINNLNFVGNLQADGSDIDVGHYAAPVFEDIDQDGDLDLYVGDIIGRIRVFENDGGGIFSTVGNLQANGSDIDVDSMSVPQFADIDGDDDSDLYIGTGSGEIKVYINDGSGIFSTAGNLQADGYNINVGYYAAPVFEDLDQDNDLDLYVGELYGQIKVFTNLGNAVFTANGYLQANGSNIDVGEYSTPAFADIDDDGDLDLCLGAEDEQIYIFTNDGSGDFSANGNLIADGSAIDVGWDAKPIFADFDGDSDFDLYIGEYYGHIKILSNDGSGIFTANGNLKANDSDIDVGAYSAPSIADIDDDGDLDLYVGEYYGSIKVFINDGSGIFSAAGNLQADGLDINVGYSAVPVFVDIDGDSDLDLCVGVGYYYGNINVFINDGTGNFSADGNLQANGSDIEVWWPCPVFADIDGDSDLDLFVGERYYPSNINVFMNDGTGYFSAAGNLQADGSDIEVSGPCPVFADIDGDNDDDLYIGGIGGTINYYINDQFNKIDNIFNSPNILIHPNPSSGILNLAIPPSFSNGHVIITDITGKTIQQFEIDDSKLTVDLSSHVNGVYFIVLNSEGICKTVKVVKE